MKRWVCLLLSAAFVAGALAGCGRQTADARFTADNEILSYERIDPSKTQLTVASLGNNADISEIAAAFEQRHPDVQIICLDLTGGNAAYRPVVDWVANGAAPDIMFINSDSFVDGALIAKYFEDLSANPAVQNFEMEALNRVAVDGHVYLLPAPSEVNCILYNKTLFDRYGWNMPATFDEFVALCLQIRADTGGAVQPWNPNAKYDNVLSTAIEAITYAELFGGADNRGWYNDFCAGKATFAGHMEPLFTMLQTLIDNDILLAEHFEYSATTRGKEFEAGQIAMYNAPISRMQSDAFTFGYAPYPATSGELGYVNDAFSALLCVPKKERGDAQWNAIDRFLGFFSSTEGQQALIGESLMVSNVRGVPLNQSGAMHGIEEVIARGHKFNRLDFLNTGGAGSRTWSLRDIALAMVKGEKTAGEIIAAIDEKPYFTLEESDTKSAKKLAEITEDFSVLEFSCYIADMYREKAGAEIGLINHAVPYRGNLVRLFAGNFYDSYLYPVRPRSFANGSKLIKVSMTGGQLMDALNHPVGNGSVSNSVYAFSGLKCRIAPWNELGSKYLSVKLADGSPLSADRLYTVAVWEGTVAEEYVTEVLEAYEGSWDTLMADKLSSDGAVAPADDGRITLVWK